jgi:hypothetical protein
MAAEAISISLYKQAGMVKKYRQIVKKCELFKAGSG